jgi:hypothetical protein
MAKAQSRSKRAEPDKNTPAKSLSNFARWLFASLVIACLVIALTKECLDFLVFNIIYYTFSVSLAGLTALIPGSIEIKYLNVLTATSAIGILIFFVAFMNPTEASNYIDRCPDKPFSVIAHLQKKNGDRKPFIGQEFSLLVGYHRPDPKFVNTLGEVIFDNIPSQYIRDTINLQATNPKFKVVSQNSWIADQHNEITFILTVDPDTTLVKGSIRLKQNNLYYPAKDASILFDNEFETTTNANGNYRISLPFKEGSNCEVSIFYKGKIVYQDQTIISSKVPTSFVIPPQ